jgi:hypothetical protein
LIQQQKTYDEQYCSHDLARSSGAVCPALERVDPNMELAQHGREFWTKGFVGLQATSNRAYSNPLFVYSSISDRQFAVHNSTDPRNRFPWSLLSPNSFQIHHTIKSDLIVAVFWRRQANRLPFTSGLGAIHSDDSPNSTSQAATFNVIDTSYLSDRIAF